MSAKFQIGEKGVTLSGGQKQRIALARALYSSAKHIIIDDCLSAVDSHTAQHLYDYALNGELTAGRTIILVTHYVSLCLRKATYVVVLNNGKVVKNGSPAEILQSGAVKDILETEFIKEEEGSKELYLDKDKLEFGKLTKKEESAKGSVSFSVYLLYFASCGGICFWLGLIVSTLLLQTMQLMQSNWVRIWADEYGFEKEVNAGYYILVYFAIGLLTVVAESITSFMLFTGTLRAGKSLHRRLLERVMKATARFFDTTPVGRIINRFSRDIQVIDQELSGNVMMVLNLVAQAIGIIVIICIAAPKFIIAGVFISIL